MNTQQVAWVLVAASVKTPRHKAVASNSRRHDLHYRCILLSFPGLGLGGSKSTLLISPSVTGSSLETGGAGMRNLLGSASRTPVTSVRGGSKIDSLERTSKLANPARKLSTAEIIALVRYEILR